MLLNMHIKNIALIEELDVSFNAGLNILTGETGAGKSIIIGSLGIGTGGRFQKELLREPDKDGLVELVFSLDDNEHIISLLKELGVNTEDDEILISRRLCSNGRTINRINDETVTITRLREICAILIDLHAQHEQQSLLKADKHLAILDRFGGEAVAICKDKVSECYTSYTKLKNTYEAALMDEADKNKKMDFLKYQIEEIKAANLVAGEDEALELEYKKAVNSKELLTTADEIYRITGYDSTMSAAEQLGHAIAMMEKLTQLDPDLNDEYNMLQDIDGLLNDFNRDLSTYMKDMEYDDKAVNELEQRLNLINSLKAKYGNTIDMILHSLSEYEEEYNRLISYEEYIAGLRAKLDKLKKDLYEAAGELTDIRKKTAVRMCELIRASLKELNFMTVEFDMHFKALEHCTSNGMDEAVFMISTNIGEPMRALYDVASGGELSRVMLAIKSSLANEDDTPTLVFDEIDVGISGRTAQSVAKKMSVISRMHQVICITHLPQIAAMSDSHYIIEKNVENNKTITNIRLLSKEEEISEIARLLGGEMITEATISNAREMKGLAEGTKLY